MRKVCMYSYIHMVPSVTCEGDSILQSRNCLYRQRKIVTLILTHATVYDIGQLDIFIHYLEKKVDVNVSFLQLLVPSTRRQLTTCKEYSVWSCDETSSPALMPATQMSPSLQEPSCPPPHSTPARVIPLMGWRCKN